MRCLFHRCDYEHTFNAVQRAFEASPHEVGVYQCRRCKDVSVGLPSKGVRYFSRANTAPRRTGAGSATVHSKEDDTL